LAFESVTGRELWRLAPPRTQRCHVSIQAHRALVATDAGYLYGLDLHDGQVRYRMRANLPFTAPLVAWGRRAVGALGGGEAGALFVSDAHRGSVLWAHEMTSRLSSTPLASHARVLVATSQGDEGALICFTSKGERAWERPLQLGSGPFTLLALDRATLVASRSGAAVRVESDGQVAWRVGAAGDPLSRTVEPCRSRGLLWLAGQMVRAVDPATGEVVGEVTAGPGLCSLALDARVNLYLLGDEGTLRAFRLGTHLSVVDRGK
ncbi:MAG TPA: PQQ-binding-like beta-propeller repeat protein, partial [Myxococcaceae bacterium]|nr:PQQ-binding-like beta-propeller repeat protein [Myxococcaceae bacterium]